MNPNEYAAQQAVISAATANYVLQFSTFFARPVLTIAQWLGLLELLFPEIARLREQSAALARSFYDSQRELEHPDLPINERFLEDYTFEWFAENMEPARKKMSIEDSPTDALGTMALRAVREVENAGRRQIIHAVENDPDTRIIRGWARVATGRETCAWCLMLISRGPTYVRSQTSGLKLDDDEALALFRDAPDLETFFENIEEHLDEWHDGCDCKVVPVFKQENWFGEEAAKRALELWKDASKTAESELDEEKVKRSGPHKGELLTKNELTINALRRSLERGEIAPSEFAALAA